MGTGEDMFSKDRKACVPHQRGNAGCWRWVYGERVREGMETEIQKHREIARNR